MNEYKQLELEGCYVRILRQVGVTHQGVRATPIRAAKAIQDLTSGYDVDVPSLFKLFESPDPQNGEIVLLKNIEFFSLCEHHLLPFFGVVHIAYIPTTHVIGVSKLARLVDAYSKRLQIQERMGHEISQAIVDNMETKGSACVIEAKHTCMMMRGVCKQGSSLTTSSVNGVFRSDVAARQELMALISKG